MTPNRITTDGYDAYPRAIRIVFGEHVRHRTKRSLNHDLEPDHRGRKQRYRPTTGLKTVATAARFCRLFDEVRAVLRSQTRRYQRLSLAQRRAIYQRRFHQLMGIMAAAYLLVIRNYCISTPTEDQLAVSHTGALDIRNSTGHLTSESRTIAVGDHP